MPLPHDTNLAISSKAHSNSDSSFDFQFRVIDLFENEGRSPVNKIRGALSSERKKKNFQKVVEQLLKIVKMLRALSISCYTPVFFIQYQKDVQ